ncbi:hypothetical protein IDH15_00235 [Pelagibacterales bacterium SAG-MED38]|nr:hypothetical protein [Pelagibacterales bacterium SAG-MED38]
MISNLKKKISLKLFGRRKPLKYILFDKLYSILILQKKNISQFVNDFDKNGFVRINPDISLDIEDLKKKLIIQNNYGDNKNTNGEKELSNKPPYYFEINDNVRQSVDSILDKLNRKYISFFKEYFNSEILPAYVCIRRNVYYEKKNLDEELFNDNFHNDGYLFTHFKLFLNLQDTYEKNGPMRIVAKNNTKKFLKKINFVDRKKYLDKDDEFIFKNVGKLGDGLIFDPTNCFHRASMPEKNYKRDYVIITYVCVPKDDKYLKYTDLFTYKNNPLLKLSKPTKLNETLQLLVNFYKKRFNHS